MLGAEAGKTLTAISTLGQVLQGQGKLDEAEPLMRESLEAMRRTLSDAHPSTLVSMINLAGLLLARGNFDGAEPLYREVLAVSRHTHGNAHFLTFVTACSQPAAASPGRS